MGIFERNENDGAEIELDSTDRWRATEVQGIQTSSESKYPNKLIGELLRDGQLSKQRADEACELMQRLGVTARSVLLQNKWASKGDIYAANERLPAAETEKIISDSAPDLPESSIILKHAGGSFGMADRVRRILAVGRAGAPAQPRGTGHRPARCIAAHRDATRARDSAV